MTRNCVKCGLPFEVDARVDARLSKFGPDHYHKVCAICAIEAIDNACADSILEMSDEEIRAELEEDGVDVDAYVARVRKLIDDCLKERAVSPARDDGGEKERG